MPHPQTNKHCNIETLRHQLKCDCVQSWVSFLEVARKLLHLTWFE